MLLNLKRTSFVLATTFTLGLTAFISTANAEATVYEGSNGTCVRGNRRVACQGINGGAAYRGVRSGAVKTPNGATGIKGPRRSGVRGINDGAV